VGAAWGVAKGVGITRGMVKVSEVDNDRATRGRAV
jgi:hypothetical protein